MEASSRYVIYSSLMQAWNLFSFPARNYEVLLLDA